MIYVPIQIDRLDGGLNLYADPTGMALHEAQLVQDVSFEDQLSLRSRRFKVKQHTNALSGVVQGIAQYPTVYPTVLSVLSNGLVYDNWVEKVSSGLHLTNKLSGFVHNNKLYFCEGVVSKKYTHSSEVCRKWGVNPPTDALTAADSGNAGNPNGAYLYKVTFVTEDDLESDSNPASTSVSVVSKKINLSSIPVSGDDQVTKRNIYRTAAGGSTYKLLTTLANNVATTYTDNIADADLGAEIDVSRHQPPPTFSQVILHYWRAWGIGDPSNPNYLWYSEPAGTDQKEIEYFGPSPRTSFQIIGGAEPCKALIAWGQTIPIWKEKSIWMCEGTDPSNLHVYPSRAGRGTEAPFSVALWDMPIFAHRDGLFSFNGSIELPLIDKKEHRIFRDDVNKSYISNMVGIVWDHKYWLSYTENGYTKNNKTLVVDLLTKSLKTLDFGITAWCVSGSGELYGGDKDGWVYKLEQTTNTDSENVNFEYKTPKLSLGKRKGEPGLTRVTKFRADTCGDDIAVRMYYDETLQSTQTFNTDSDEEVRLKMPSKRGRYLELDFTYTGQNQITLVPPIKINPEEPS